MLNRSSDRLLMLATNLPEQATSTANGVTLTATLQRPSEKDAVIL